jgi:hypothetical protein
MAARSGSRCGSLRSFASPAFAGFAIIAGTLGVGTSALALLECRISGQLGNGQFDRRVTAPAAAVASGIGRGTAVVVSAYWYLSIYKYRLDTK